MTVPVILERIIWLTGPDGTFLVTDIDPNTTLVVKEVRAKPGLGYQEGALGRVAEIDLHHFLLLAGEIHRLGYLLDDVAQTAVVKAGQTVRLQFINHKAGNLIIHKLSGADKKTA